MSKPQKINRRNLLGATLTAGLAASALSADAQTSQAQSGQQKQSLPSYSKDDTALLIIDPYNDFMSEGGKLYKQTLETAKEVGFHENMRKLIPAVRAA